MKGKKVVDTTYTCKVCGGRRIIEISWLNHEKGIYDDSEYECINCGNTNWGMMNTKGEERMSQFKYKQAIILRKDIKMPPGKAIGQGSHVAVSSAVEVHEKNRDTYDAWMKEGQAKIVLKAGSLEELLALKKKAEEKGLQTAIIADLGLTVLEPGTITAIAIGPDASGPIDEIVKDLKLF